MSRRPTFQASYPSGSSPEGVRSPINSTISYPQVLDPEHGPQTVHTSDLYFANSRPMNPRQNTEFPRRTSNPSNTQPRPTSSELYPYHLQGFQHHYSPPPPVFRARQDTYSQYEPPPPTYLQQHPTYGPIYASDEPPAPPLPPKPIEYPTITTAPSYGQYAATQPPPPPLLPSLPPLLPPTQEVEEILMSPTEDSNELAMAIALSQSESIKRQKLQEDLRNQEEEDLAKALAESLLSTGSHVNESMNPFFIPEEESIAPSPQYAEHTSALPTSEARAAVDLPSYDTPTPTHPANTLPPLSLPTFGRHEKWRLPGVSDNGIERSHKSDDNASNLDKNPTFKFPSPEGQVPPAESLSRPSSISSITSLAYMRADPNEDGKDVDDQLHDGNQDSTDDPSDTYISNFKDISPSAWTSGDTNDSFVEPEDANVLEFDDEAYARQLAAEEEAMAAQSQYQYPNEKAFPQYGQDYGVSHHYMPEERQNNFYNSSSSSNGQLYATRRPTFSSDSTSSSAPISTPTSSSHSPSVAYSPSSNSSHLPEYGLPASINHFQKRPSISYVNSGSLPYSPVVYPALGHRHEAEFDSVSDSSHHSSAHSSASAPPALQPGNQTSSAPSLNQHRPSGAAPAVTPGASPVITGAAVPGAGLRNPNHFVDAELLLGVSIGFTPPPVTAKLLPLQDPMPNIISLPYNKCPPLHLQAPDWRHLLRLMARLSGTRIEPTVEAMAVSKTDLKLRTVVQFIKPYQHANDWRTILWFTIDHPVPPSMPGAARYSHSNPNMLPWSYTLSPVPMLLRDAADTHISKTYTIPATDSVPLPVLPITFPSLALYLQAALDASRMHSSDTSTGLGKLGKLVQMCYPSVEQTYSEFDIPERTRMSDMFKRVIKRSNKDKKKGKGTNNEETYQLVTPFVPDEWG